MVANQWELAYIAVRHAEHGRNAPSTRWDTRSSPMRVARMKRAACALVSVLLMSTAAPSLAASACGGCGCQRCMERVCRIVCATKDVKTTVYTVECEDFCTLGPSCNVVCESTGCEPGCGPACSTGCGHDGAPLRAPTCGRAYTKRKLVKREITKKVPIYKCVVEYVCPDCGGVCAAR